MTPPVALTIAGSDSGGAAGIQADLKTLAACGVFGTCAVTAVAAQNTTEVRAVHALAADILVAQIVAVLDDFEVRAVKTGLLATAANLVAIADLADAGRLPNLVVDPVMVASSGRRLLDPDVERLYVERLFRQATVVTPNLWEAGVLLDTELHTHADQRDAAKQLAALGPRAVVVKGGHPTHDAGDLAVDIVAIDGDIVQLTAPRIHTAHTHGSGCTFASCIAAQLALGRPPLDAVRTANRYVHRAITGGAHWHLGAGHGPLDHFNWETP